MVTVSRIVGDQTAPGGESNSDMGATFGIAQALQLELACQVAVGGDATVRLQGELDIATADQAYAYLRDVVDSQDGPVTVDLAELTFCDAAGLGVLARMARHARRRGRPVRLTAARPSLLRIMHITGMDEAFPEVRNPALGIIAWPRQTRPQRGLPARGGPSPAAGAGGRGQAGRSEGTTATGPRACPSTTC